MKKLIWTILLCALTLILSACGRANLGMHSVLISAGGNHTCVLSRQDGVRCWGGNRQGQLGDGTFTDSLTPVQVSAAGKDVVAVVAGSQHTCALSAQGQVRCWGANEHGQLGDGTLAGRPLPVDVAGLGEAASAVATGDRHTCTLSMKGRVRCWGSNERGQLGTGALADSPFAVDVPGMESDISAIAAGSAHTCALTRQGAVRCWGANDFGQLGNKTRKDSRLPVAVTGLDSGMVAIAAGGGQTCALTAAGAVKCWGWNGNEAESRYVLKPEDVGGLESGVTALAVGGEHSCALLGGNEVRCWGSNYVGQLGSDVLPSSSIPVGVGGLGNGILAIAAGGYHSCVISMSAGVECWGQNYQGELGSEGLSSSATPIQIVSLKAIAFVPPTATDTPTSLPTPTETPLPPTPTPWPTLTPMLALQPGQALTMTWLDMLDANTGWGIDSSGHILRTTDGGSNWRFAGPPRGAYAESGFFAADAGHAWAAWLPVLPGGDGCGLGTDCRIGAAIWQTADGGSTWQPAERWQATRVLPRPGNSAPYGAAPRALFFLDPDTGFLLLEDWHLGTNITSVLARTTDGGKSLREVWRDDGIGRYTGVVFINKQAGYLGEDNTTFFDSLSGLPSVGDYIEGRQAPYLKKTSDGGKTWEVSWLPRLDPIPAEWPALASAGKHMLCSITELEPLPPAGMMAEVTCRVSGASGPYSFYYLSADGGQTWHSWLATGSESFRNAQMGWRLSATGQFQGSADGGLTWVTLNTLPSRGNAHFDFIDDQTGWAIVTGSTTGLMHTTDGGHHWTEIWPVVVNP